MLDLLQTKGIVTPGVTIPTLQIDPNTGKLTADTTQTKQSVGSKIGGFLNSVFGGVKLPEVHTQNSVGIEDKSMLFIGAIVVIILLFFSGKSNRNR